MDRRDMLGTSFLATIAAALGLGAPAPVHAAPARRHPDGWADALVDKRPLWVDRIQQAQGPDNLVRVSLRDPDGALLDQAGVARVDIYAAEVDPRRPEMMAGQIPLDPMHLAVILVPTWDRAPRLIATSPDKTRLLRCVARREDGSIAGQWGFYAHPSQQWISLAKEVPIEDGFGPYGTTPER